MLTLTLDGQPVDLPTDAEVALTLWAHDLRAASTREATFSETFTLPPTARNRAAWGTPGALDSRTGLPYRKVPALLAWTGVPLLDGVAVLEQAGGGGLDVTLYASTADLFAAVGKRRLRDLNLSALDHYLTYEAIEQASGPQAPARGYVYPLYDDGRLDRDERLLYHELAPFVPYLTVLRAIVTEALPGYTLAGSLLADPRFVNAGFPRATPFPVLRSAVRDGAALAARTAADVSFANNIEPPVDTFPIVPFPVVTKRGGAAVYEQNQYFRVPVGVPADVTVRVALRLRVAPSLPPPRSGGTVEVRLIANPNGPGGPVSTNPPGIAVVALDVAELDGPTDWLPVRAEATFTHLPPGALVAVQLRINGLFVVTVETGATVAYTLGERTYVGGPVHLETGLPDLNHAEALQLMAAQFLAVFQTDEASRTVRADLFTDLERRRDAPREWGAAVDRAAPPAVTFRLDGTAQHNRYAYAAPPAAYDVLNLTPDAAAGAGVLPVPDATLPAETTAYEAPVYQLQVHAARGGKALLGWAPAVVRGGKGYHAYDNNKEYHNNDGPVLWGGRYYQYGGADRIGPGFPPPNGNGSTVWKPLTEADVLAPADGGGAVGRLIPYAGAPVRAQRDDPDPAGFVPAWGLTGAGLDWGADLLPAYYPTLAALLDGVRVVRVELTLTAADIAQLDHLVPVRLRVPYWPGVGGLDELFYVNLVDQYRPGVPGPTAVELVRLGLPVPGIAPAAAPFTPPVPFALLAEDGTPLYTEPGVPDGAPLTREHA